MARPIRFLIISSDQRRELRAIVNRILNVRMDVWLLPHGRSKANSSLRSAVWFFTRTPTTTKDVGPL